MQVIWLLITVTLVAGARQRRPPQRVRDNCDHISGVTLKPRIPTNSELAVCRAPGENGTERNHCCNRLLEDQMQETASGRFGSIVWEQQLMQLRRTFKYAQRSLNSSMMDAFDEISSSFHDTTKMATADQETAKKHSWMTAVHMYTQTVENSLPHDEDSVHIMVDDRDNINFEIKPYMESEDCRTEFWRLLQHLNATRAFSRVRLITGILTAAEKLGQVGEALKMFASFPECTTAMMRMELCPKCDYQAAVPACTPLCHNVMSGCWYPVYHALGKQWNHLLKDIEEMRTQIGNVEGLLQEIVDNMSTVMRYIRPVKEENEKVMEPFEYCSRLYKPRKSALDLKSIPSFLKPEVDMSKAEKALSELLEHVQESRPNIRHMPSMICKAMKKDARRYESHSCWDGEKLTKSYDKPVSYLVDSATTQAHNPEVTLNTSLYSTLLNSLAANMQETHEMFAGLISKPDNMADFEFGQMIRHLQHIADLPADEMRLKSTTEAPSTTHQPKTGVKPPELEEIPPPRTRSKPGLTPTEKLQPTTTTGNVKESGREGYLTENDGDSTESPSVAATPHRISVASILLLVCVGFNA